MDNWITDFNGRVRSSNAPPQNRRYQQNGPSLNFQPGGPRPLYPQYFGGADLRRQNYYPNQQNSYVNHPNSNVEEAYDVKPPIGLECDSNTHYGPGEWQRRSGPSSFMQQQPIPQFDTRHFYGPPPPIHPPSGINPNFFQSPQYSSNYNADTRSHQTYFRPNNVRQDFRPHRPSVQQRLSTEHQNKNNPKSPVVQNRNLVTMNSRFDLENSSEQTACVTPVPDNSVKQSSATGDNQSKTVSTPGFDSRPMSSISVSTSSATLPSTPRSCSVSAKEMVDIKQEPGLLDSNEDILILLDNDNSGEDSEKVVEEQIPSSDNKTSTQVASTISALQKTGSQSNQNLFDDDDLELLLNSPVGQEKRDTELNEELNEDDLLNSPVGSEHQNESGTQQPNQELNEDDLLNSPVGSEHQKENDTELNEEVNEDDLLNSPIDLEQQKENEDDLKLLDSSTEEVSTGENQKNDDDHSIQTPTLQNLDNSDSLDSPPRLQREEPIESSPAKVQVNAEKINNSEAISNLQILIQTAPNLVSNINSVLNQNTPTPSSATSNQVLTPVPIQTTSSAPNTIMTSSANQPVLIPNQQLLTPGNLCLSNSTPSTSRQMIPVNNVAHPMFNCGTPLNVQRIQNQYAFFNSCAAAGAPIVFVPVPYVPVNGQPLLVPNPVQIATTPTKQSQQTPVRVTVKQSPIWKLQINGSKLFTKLSANEAQCNGCLDQATNSFLKFRISGSTNSLHKHVSTHHPNFVKQLNLLKAQTVTELENTMNQHAPPQVVPVQNLSVLSNRPTVIQPAASVQSPAVTPAQQNSSTPQSAQTSSSNHCSVPVSSATNVSLTPRVHKIAESLTTIPSASLSIAEILTKSVSPLQSSIEQQSNVPTDTQLPEARQSPPISGNDLTWSTTTETSTSARVRPIQQNTTQTEDLNQQDVPDSNPVPENLVNEKSSSTDFNLDNLDNALGIREHPSLLVDQNKQNNPTNSSQDRIPSTSSATASTSLEQPIGQVEQVPVCKECKDKEKPVYKKERCRTCYGRLIKRQNREYHQRHENMFVLKCLQANNSARKRKQPSSYIVERQIQDQIEQEKRKRVRFEKDNDIQHSSESVDQTPPHQPIVINGVQIKEEPIDELEYIERSYTIPSDIVARMETSTDASMETTHANKCFECEVLIEDELVSESPNHCLDCFKNLNYCICSKCKEVKKHKAKGKCTKCYQQDKYGKSVNLNSDTTQPSSLQLLDKPSDNVCADCKQEKQIRDLGRCTVCYYVYKSAERDDSEIEVDESEEQDKPDDELEALPQNQPDEHPSDDEPEDEVDAPNQLNLTEPSDQLILNGPGAASGYTPKGWKKGQCKLCRCKLTAQNKSSSSKCVNYCANCFETKLNQKVCIECNQTKRHYGKGMCTDCYRNKAGRSHSANNTILNEANTTQEDVPESRSSLAEQRPTLEISKPENFKPIGWKVGECKLCRCKLNAQNRPKNCVHYCAHCFETKLNQRVCIRCNQTKRHYGKGMCTDCYYNKTGTSQSANSANTTQEDVPESRPTPQQVPVFFGAKTAATYTPIGWKKGQCKVCNCKLANVARPPEVTKCTNYCLECYETRINQCICVDCKLQKRHNSQGRCYECFNFMRRKSHSNGKTTTESSTNQPENTDMDDDIIEIPGPIYRTPIQRPSTRSQRVQSANQANVQRQIPAVQPQRPPVPGAIINAMARTVQINNIEYIELSSGEESD